MQEKAERRTLTRHFIGFYWLVEHDAVINAIAALLRHVEISGILFNGILFFVCVQFARKCADYHGQKCNECGYNETSQPPGSNPARVI